MENGLCFGLVGCERVVSAWIALQGHDWWEMRSFTHDQSLRKTERIPGLSYLLRLKIIEHGVVVICYVFLQQFSIVYPLKIYLEWVSGPKVHHTLLS
jgi:hypothetical protein